MKILIVEDNFDHQELMTFALKDHDTSWTMEAVGSSNDLIDRLDHLDGYGLVILDYSLPGEDGLELLHQIKQREDPPPVIMVTGRGDEETAVSVMKAGAFDYLIKGNDYLTRLPIMAKRAVDAHQLIIDRQFAEEELRKSEQRYRHLVEKAPTGILSTDLDGNIQEVNPRLLEILGSPSAEETKKINLFDFNPLKEAGVTEIFKKCIETGQSLDASHPYTSKWGKTSFLRYHLSPIHDMDENIIGVQANVIDISKRMEAQIELEKLNEELEERVLERTRDLETLVSAMAGREVRMAELKKVIKKLRKQLQDEGHDPIADDPLNNPDYFVDNDN